MSVYHVPLESLIPITLPPAKEPENSKETIHFTEIFNAFDPYSVKDDALERFSKTEWMYTGADSGEKYTYQGLTLPYAPMPFDQALSSIQESFESSKEVIPINEEKWRSGRKSYYQQSRYSLQKGIREKLILRILNEKKPSITEEELKRQRNAYIRYQEWWKLKYIKKLDNEEIKIQGAILKNLDVTEKRFDRVGYIRSYLLDNNNDAAYEAINKAVTINSNKLWERIATVCDEFSEAED